MKKRVLILLTIMSCFVMCNVPELKETYVVHKIESTSLKEDVYLKRMNRGLNYSETFITKNPNNEKPNEEVDYIFRNLDVTVFYEVKDGILRILTSAEVKLPQNTNFNIQVDFVKIKSNSEYLTISKNHKEKGLIKWDGSPGNK